MSRRPRLVDIDWRVGVTASTSETNASGASRVSVRLTLEEDADDGEDDGDDDAAGVETGLGGDRASSPSPTPSPTPVRTRGDVGDAILRPRARARQGARGARRARGRAPWIVGFRWRHHVS